MINDKNKKIKKNKKAIKLPSNKKVFGNVKSRQGAAKGMRGTKGCSSYK